MTAWREINAVAVEGGILTLQPRGVNLEHKFLELPRHCCIFWCSKFWYESWFCSVKWRSLLRTEFLICIFIKFCLPILLIFLCLHILIISVERTVRQMTNNGLSVSDVMFLVYLLSQFSCNIVRLTKHFLGLCSFLYDTAPS